MTGENDTIRPAEGASSPPRGARRGPGIIDVEPSRPDSPAEAASESLAASGTVEPAPVEPVAAEATEAEAAVTEPVSPRVETPVPAAREPNRFAAPAAAGFVGGAVAAALIAIGMTTLGGNDTADRLAALENGLGEKATRRSMEAVEKRTMATESAVQALRGDLDGLAKRVSADAGQTGDALKRLESSLSDTAAKVGAQPPAPPPPPPPVPVLGGRESAILSVSWLVRDALNRGTPYQRELGALKAAGVDDAALAPLQPFAGSGAPTAQALAARLAPAVEALSRGQEPGAPAPAPSGLTDRISSTIGRLYKVQPLAPGQADSPAGIAARAETALRAGSLTDAAAAFAALPASAPAELRAVADTVRQRLAAAQAADSLVARSVDQVITATQSAGGTAR